MNNFNIYNTGVVIDSDRTMTKGSYAHPDGEKRIDYTSYSVLERHGEVHPNFFSRADELYDFYYEKEQTTPVGPEKTQYMIDWVMKVNNLYSEYITKDIFENALDKGVPELEMRRGMKEFLEFLRGENVPTLIFSAGVSNVIHRVLEYNGFSGSGIDVFGNEMQFDENGDFLIPNEKSIIHPENKNWKSVPSKIQSKFSNRVNQIVLGDSPGDIDMGDTEKVIHSIGFLLQANKKPDEIKDIYDQVIESEECDLGELAKIQKSLQIN